MDLFLGFIFDDVGGLVVVFGGGFVVVCVCV